MEQVTYSFLSVDECDMCGAQRDRHRTLGMRLNKSQGWRPREVSGLAVSIKQCEECGLIFPDPHPIPQKISDHYEISPEDYFDESQRTLDPNYFAEEIKQAKQLIGFTPGMKALDIGVGMGKGMKALDDAGFDTWGIEPSHSFSDYAVKQLGIAPERILNETVENAELPRDHFDFIVFGAVLEHLHSPARALGSVLNWLKPGGVIHAEVPSSHYLMARFANLYFGLNMTNFVTHLSPMHPPYHLYEFTPQSFQKNGRRLGYDVALHLHKPGPIQQVPEGLHRLLRALMRRTGREMQLTIFLKKRPHD